jgi:regulation of enolase protein 1 (concanavalin A-like superfamily)
MSLTTTCPTCGLSFGLPADYPGGKITCPNTACRYVFEAVVKDDHAAILAAAAAGAAARGPRPPGARPELLDQLPGTFLTSPAIIAVGGVFVFLYGVVLFGAVSAYRHRPLPPAPAPPPVAYVPPPPPLVLPPEDASKSEPEKKEKAVVKGEPKKKSPRAGGSKSEAPKRKRPSPKPTVPPKTEIARANPGAAPAPAPAPAVPPTPPPVEAPKTAAWGDLTGATGDCQFLADGPALAIEIPGKLHVLSPELMKKNAPRLLTEVTGDFVATVKVVGAIRPGTKPIGKLQFTFQGAGLLVWQDEDNYLRLERTSIFSTMESRRLHQVLLELCREGKTITVLRDARDADLALRFDRRGSEIRCSYSPDGKTWLEVKRQMVQFPAEVRVGVSASNASPKTFRAELTDFELTAPEAKTRKSP